MPQLNWKAAAALERTVVQRQALRIPRLGGSSLRSPVPTSVRFRFSNGLSVRDERVSRAAVPTPPRGVS